MSDVARELRREPLAADPLALCRALGIDRPAKRQGAGLLICCPAHAEKDPSCSVRVAGDGTVAVRCHACGWSADAIGLVRQVHSLDFPEALKELARITGRWDLVDATQPRRPPPSPRPPPAPEPPRMSDDDFHRIATMLLERCALRPQRDVWAYLEERGLESEAEMAGLAALPSGAAAQRALHDELIALGADLDGAGLAHGGRFVYGGHRLVIPWRDRAGRVETLQRRRIDGDEPKYVFPRGRQMRSPFGVDLFDAAMDAWGGQAEVIVSEGALDALARRRLARMSGLRAVVIAIPSATTLLEERIVDLADGRDVILSFDNDEAGAKAVARLLKPLKERACTVVRERPGSLKDMGEVLQRRLRA